MSAAVTVIDPPDLGGKRRALVLAEDRVGHYPEFRAFFERTFALDRIGLSRPGYVALSGGAVYELVFIGRSGEAFPAEVEINAIVSALEPIDEDGVDRDLWAILRWMIEGVGPPWTVADLDATGRLYRLPAAEDRSSSI
jgi:hypothetical protein